MMRDKFYVAGIGASAGGLKALKEFVHPIPPNTGIAFVVVTHLSRNRESNLATLISKETCLPVIKIIKNTVIRPDHIYVLAEDTMIEVDQGIINVRKREDHEKVNHAIDLFLTSLATDFKEMAIGVVLSGCGSDGLEGAKALNKTGGVMIIQSPESADFPDMPEAIIDKDHPFAKAVPNQLIKEIIKRIHN